MREPDMFRKRPKRDCVHCTHFSIFYWYIPQEQIVKIVPIGICRMTSTLQWADTERDCKAHFDRLEEDWPKEMTVISARKE